MLKNGALVAQHVQSEFVLQWHITTECENRCAHCYIPNCEKDEGSLGLEDCFKVVDELASIAKRYHIDGRINFSGGNPLLRKDFPKLLEYTRSKGIIPCILGNAYPFTEDVLDMLEENEIFRYQLSLDGFKERHDAIRGRGNFDTTVEGIGLLAERGIWVSIMTTITKDNYQDAEGLAEFVFEKGAKHYDFARLVPVGEGEALADSMIGAEEYRAFLYGMFEKYCELKKRGAREGFFGTKDPLWKLLFLEMGLLDPFSKESIQSGCTIGRGGLCIDADGSVYGCRRLPITIGNVKEDSLWDLFIQSSELNREREFESLEKCGDCEIMSVCRGCRAVAYACTGNYFSPDPQCWRGE